MPGLEDLKDFIATVKNTQNIFDAMKLIIATNV
jgi:F0F1-type ATP synthase gamma subunit